MRYPEGFVIVFSSLAAGEDRRAAGRGPLNGPETRTL